LFASYKPRLKKKNSVYAIFLLSYIAILILTLSSAFIYYAEINQRITKQTELSTVTLLNQMKIRIEDDLFYIKELSNEIVFNKKLDLAAKGATDSNTELMKDMASKRKPRELLFDYFVYMSARDEIITPNIQMEAEKFFHLMYEFTDLDYATFAEEYLHGNHFQEYMPIQKMNQYESNTIEVLPYIQSFPMTTSSRPSGQVIFLIDAHNMFTLVNQMHQVTNSDIYILDENNRIIISSDNAPVLDIQKVDLTVNGSNTRHEIINKVVSDKNGWIYISSTPKSLYFQENTKYFLNFIAIFLVYLVGGLFIVRFLARRSYKPLKEINDLIKSHAKAPTDSQNEYENIKNTLLVQIKNGKELNEVIEKQIPIVRRDYLLNLIRGMMTDYDKAAQQLSSIGIHFASDTFLIGALEIDMDSSFFMDHANLSEKSLSLTRVVAENVGCELMSDYFICYFLDAGRNQSIYLLNPREDSDPAEAIKMAKQQADALIQFASRHYRLNLNFGISNPHSELINLQNCYDEAKKAMEYSRLRDVDETVCFGDLGDLHFDYYYSMETEYQLADLLKRGQYVEAKEFLNTIFEINTSKNIGIGAAKLLLYEIASTLLKVMNFFLLSRNEEPVSNKQIVEQLIQNSSIDVARRRFIDMIDKIAELSENRVISKTEKLVNRIADYIDENAGEHWLDLNQLSQRFEVTPQYISNVFKKYKHENVKDYIAKHKLGKAKALLVSTNLSIREIALHLGYANEVGITRLFKKYEGMTPGDYRQKHRNDVNKAYHEEP
jgi:AraC-like DNA-binding protein